MKVVFFDYWTKGLHHFVPIDRALKAAGHSTLLIHLGSLREDCPKEEVLKDILCRDIRFYKSHLIYDILREERPDVVLTLNARTVFDRALVISCRKLGIRTVFLAHGIDVFLDDPDSGSKVFEKTVNNVGFLLPRVGKYVSMILPNYFHAIWKSGAGPMGLLRGLRTLFSFAINPGRTVLLPPAIEEVAHDRHLLFSAQAVEAICKIGYPRAKVFAVGNPKNDDLLNRLQGAKFRTFDLPPEVQELVKAERPYALVLEDSFPESMGMAGWTAEYRNRWLREMAAGLRQNGFEMVVKLHPVSDKKSIDLGNEKGLVFQSADLDALIRFSKFCIAHSSTTVDNCVILDKPVVTPVWGLSKSVSEYFIDLKISRAWHAPKDQPDLSIDQAAREKYKAERITILEPIAARNVVAHLTAG